MLLEAPLPVEGARACLDCNGAGGDLGNRLHETVTHDPALESDRSRLGDAMELEHVLRDVDAKGVDGHRVSSSSSAPLSCRAGGRAVHPIRWKKQFAGMGVTEIRRLRQLEDENARLKRLVADLTLDKTMLQDVLKRKW